MSQTWPILINLGAALMGAIGQYLYKIGAHRLKEVSIFYNWHIILGIIFFTGVMAMFILAFRLGGRISVTYPVYASTFLWGSLLGVVIDKEPFHFMQMLGIFFVVLGILFMAIYSK